MTTKVKMTELAKLRREQPHDAVKQQRWGVVAQQPEESNGGFTFTVIRVLMACDECDTPWIEVPHA